MNSIAQLHIVHAFDYLGIGGNPAGVVLDAESLSAEKKQSIAAGAGMSETAFVSPSDVADFKLEFFTPSRQIAHCGHATIAAFSYLRQIGRVVGKESSKETIDGCRAIHIEGQAAFMEQRAPVYFDPVVISSTATIDRIQASLGVGPSALAAQHPPIVCSTGNRFLLVAVRDSLALSTLKPDMEKVREISEVLDLIGYYAWVPMDGECSATTRMFAPRYGIDEEAGTGMAAGPLASYLYDYGVAKVESLLIEQGAFMEIPSPSRLKVNLEFNNGQIHRLFVGGTARHIRTMDVAIDTISPA